MIRQNRCSSLYPHHRYLVCHIDDVDDHDGVMVGESATRYFLFHYEVMILDLK